jgi:hypothetical protein
MKPNKLFTPIAIPAEINRLKIDQWAEFSWQI